MSISNLRFGALQTQVTPTENGKTITLQATDNTALRYKRIFSPADAKCFDGKDGILLKIPKPGDTFDFNIEAANGSGQHTLETPETIGTFGRLCHRLMRQGEINTGEYDNLLAQCLQKNGGKPIILCTLPANPFQGLEEKSS